MGARCRSTPIRSTAPTARRPRDPRRRTRRDDSSTVAPAEPSPARRCTARTGGAMIVLWFHPAVQLHMLCLCEGRSEVGVELLELLLGGRGDRLVFGDLVNEARGHGWEGCTELGLEAANILDGNLVKVSTDTSKQDDSLLCNLHWHVLWLLQDLLKTLSTHQLELGGGVKV